MISWLNVWSQFEQQKHLQRTSELSVLSLFRTNRWMDGVSGDGKHGCEDAIGNCCKNILNNPHFRYLYASSIRYHLRMEYLPVHLVDVHARCTGKYTIHECYGYGNFLKTKHAQTKCTILVTNPKDKWWGSPHSSHICNQFGLIWAPAQAL